MQIILLSGGSGQRLWPLSNGTRSKQFLKLLADPQGREESMVQRVCRQIREVCPGAEITIATQTPQVDPITSQLGGQFQVVAEPHRRGTFPAIALACAFLSFDRQLPDSETVVAMPVDVFAQTGYFRALREMDRAVQNDAAHLILMGVPPTHAAKQFGYILPDPENPSRVAKFVEKPSTSLASSLLEEGAVWNGGAFAFRLGYLRRILQRYSPASSYDDIRRDFDSLPKISFDCEVAEQEPSRAVVFYTGPWKDLGSWDALAREISHSTVGNAIENGCTNTTAINELNIPLVCHGTKDLIVAASPDGILVADKSQSHSIKQTVASLSARPMYEERRWGTYKVIDNIEFPDGFCALTKQLTLNPGCSISYQKHSCRDEVWTFIDGHGEIVIDGKKRPVARGETVTIPKGTLHALRAISSLTFIEVQRGSNLIEEDIQRFPLSWE